MHAFKAINHLFTTYDSIEQGAAMAPGQASADSLVAPGVGHDPAEPVHTTCNPSRPASLQWATNAATKHWMSYVELKIACIPELPSRAGPAASSEGGCPVAPAQTMWPQSEPLQLAQTS